MNKQAATASQETRSNGWQNQPGKQQGRKRSGTMASSFSALRYWWMEVVSCVLALIALAAIVATVGVYNGRPLPNWPHPISINSMISIFTAIFRAALVMPIAEGISQLKWYWFGGSRPLIDLERFDAASRGPAGSLFLLFDARKHYLASLGSFIIVAALAVDPFSQQIIQYFDCMQPDSGITASIPKTNRYSTGGMHTGAGQSTLDGPTQVAVMMGLLNPPDNSSSSISVDCPTGNCTFPAAADDGATFSTLAMCYSCTDISASVSVNDTKVPTNYTLASGAWAGQQVLASTSTARSADYGDAVYTFEALMLNYPSSCNTDESEAASTTECTYPETPFAVRCSIFPCLQTYGANVTQSVYNETLVSSTNLPQSFSSTNAYMWSLATDSVLQNGTWSSCNASTSPSSTNTVAVETTNKTLSNGKATDVSYYPDTCIWAYNHSAANPLRIFLANMFMDNMLQFSTTPAATEGDLWLENLYRNGTADIDSVNKYMDGLTTSLSANIRTRGDDTLGSGYATGTPMVSKTCVRVRWGWIALPASLLALALGFLVALMVVVRKWEAEQGHRVGAWKSSALVPLFHGLDDETIEKHRQSARGDAAVADDDGFSSAISRHEMQDVARRMRVQLRYEGDGLKFVDAFSDSEVKSKSAEEPIEYVSPGEEQRYSQLASDSGGPVENHQSRPLSWISHRSVSPMSNRVRGSTSED